MGLQQFEERLERLVEGTLAKPFRSNLQPVEIGRRLTREMDLHRRVGVRGLIAPNAFAVTLSPADVSRFANFIDALSRELSDAAREHAKIESYSFVGPVEVEIFEGSIAQGWPLHRHGRGPRERGRRVPGRARPTRRPARCGGLRRPGHRPAARVRGRAPGLQREPAPRRVAAEGRRGLRHGSRVHQRHQGERHSRPGAAPGQRGRDQRRIDEAHLRNVVTAGGGAWRSSSPRRT